MLFSITKNKFLRFLFTSSSIYLILYLIYQFYIKRYTVLDQAFIRLIINSADVILHAFGFKTMKILRDTDYQAIAIDGSNGIWIGAACNAITLFFLFTVFIVAYPGEQKKKIWYIPLGIFAIHFLNILRVVALAIIALYQPASLDFNHTYTFTFVVYGFIFMLWMIWVNKFAEPAANKNQGVS